MNSRLPPRAALHRADLVDLAQLLPLVSAFHAEEEVPTTEDQRMNGIMPILRGSPHGEFFLVGPRMAPAGYAFVSYGWSLEFGGLDAFLDEFYLRPAVRGKGLAGDVLHALSLYLADRGAGSLTLEVDYDNAPAISAYERSGFQRRGRYGLMSRTLA
ncbi:MAG: GNAT family N-acetyltransferase [Pseudomonadota bacterium]